MQDIKQANYHFNLFIKKLKYHFSKYKKNTYKDLKYLVAYEYQNRGAVHFHIIFSEYIPNKVVRKCWPYGMNKKIKVRKGTNKYIIKYLTKYFVKTQDKIKSKNLKDLNIKAYRFSDNCTDPVVKVGVIEMCKMELIASLKGAKNKFMFVDKQGYKMGVSIDSDWNKDYFWQMEEYIPYDKKQYQHWKEQKLFFENYKKRHKKIISLNNNLLIQ
ncbi:Spiroplasmavirus-related protein [Spiroplasma kunkelii CR2-3x]|uniref:Spiroplasmavirus-related protein n=1 Tax=Spiroplasma kunkelii CR2-3x TaxID=273035 RepID=A0A0K2JI24_SPIKU|nr:hypothetical protein [Spiroplasma kunkelii]ALA98082.1 Spiroplasmavirus-related protein [Spiroplasma kunkelii CR2-3x]